MCEQMDTNFKVPTIYNRIKFASRKPGKSLTVVGDKPSSACERNKDIPKAKPCSLKSQYIEPKWSAKPIPEHIYGFEVLKSGIIAETFSDLQSRAYWLIGKLPDNHISMAHPTISRYHAVFQYRSNVKEELHLMEDGGNNETEAKKSNIEKGWYLYDLNSTHGSYVNKTRIPPKTYVRVRVGYMLRFGGSTRNFILQGPDFDEEAESELSVTEIKELRHKTEEEYLKNLKAEKSRKESEGVSWGMEEDAEEETDMTVNPFAATNNEELFLQDPKKTLRGYFEREGHELEYIVNEMSPGTFLCRIELPVSDANGRPVIAELCHKGKKKECVHQYSDGDDDFYDRTGDVERKKQEREAANQNKTLSYHELVEREKQLSQSLDEVNGKIDNYKKLEKKLKQRSYKEDGLDDFMSNLSYEKPMDKTEIRKLRIEEQRIKNEHNNLKRLIKIARPVDLMPHDDFYDRTGDVERKKQEREAANQNKTLSYHELVEREKQLSQSLDEVNGKIDNYKKLEKKLKQRSYKEDGLDDFMSNLSYEKPMDKTEIRKLRIEEQRIKNEHNNLKRLIKIARPVDLMPRPAEPKTVDSEKKKHTPPMFGKRVDSAAYYISNFFASCEEVRRKR
ncbi:Kanadaptin, partial [Pseudolycoriella hygida]